MAEPKTEDERMREQQQQLQRESRKEIDRFREIHRAVQAVADHWRQLPRPR